ncbi:MAG: methyltransferase domain-containing protein [archaeon]
MKLSKKLTRVLACPVCRSSVKKTGDKIKCTRKHEFPIEKIPILLTDTKGWKAKEIEEQNEMSEQYTSKRETLLFSLFVNNRWNNKILSGADRPEKALDAGCGTGMLMHAIQRRFRSSDVYGFDLSPGMAAYANTKNPGNVVCGDVEHIPFKSKQFDLVTCRGVLHHLPDERKALKELRRILRKDGTLIISDTSNDNILLRFVRRFIRKHKGFRTGELAQEIKKAGFDVKDVQYFGFLTFPFGLPDLFPLFRKSRQEWFIRLLSWIDEKIEKNKKLQKLCFHAIYICTAA